MSSTKCFGCEDLQLHMHKYFQLYNYSNGRSVVCLCVADESPHNQTSWVLIQFNFLPSSYIQHSNEPLLK